MREWDEITRDLLRRRDEKIAQKKAQMRVIRRTVISALCLCLTVSAGLGVWKYAPGRSGLDNEPNDPVAAADVTTSVIDDKIPDITVTASASGIVTGTQARHDTVTTSSFRNASAVTASVKQTAAATSAALTKKPESVVTTSTNVSIAGPIMYEERNVTMRRFLAVLAATSIMANPIAANASPIVRFDPDGDWVNSSSLDYDKIESGQLDPDFNGDGKFDVYDVYYSNEIMDPDFELIANYYIRENGINPEDYRIENFRNAEGGFTQRAWSFLGYFSHFNEPNLKYERMVKYDAENNVSLDFNADGVTDVKDCLDYWMFESYLVDYSCWHLKDDDYADELRAEYGVDPDSYGWGFIHRLDSVLGKESVDIGFCIPADKYYLDFPMDETTLKNCAQYYYDHYYIGYIADAGAVLLTKNFVNNFGFSEEWLDPEYCRDYLISNADPKYMNDWRFRGAVADITGIDESFNDGNGHFYEKSGYGYEYMGEARVDAIEAGLVKYEDYCDILSWHSNNQNYMSATYPEYEKAVRDGRISVPDMNSDGKLDDADMEVLSVCYRVISIRDYSLDQVLYDVKHWYDKLFFSRANIGRVNENLDRPDWKPDVDAIASLDCNENGIICDDYDVLFAGIYISKYGNVDFDLYNEFFASEIYQEYENRNWRYYDRNSGRFSDMRYGVYYDYIVSLGDLLFDMEAANPKTPKAPSGAPHRTGDADVSGDVAMNDVVLIMQSLCNPNKYAMCSRGEFNADVNNTNDGITPMDALAVQQRLLNVNE